MQMECDAIGRMEVSGFVALSAARSAAFLAANAGRGECRTADAQPPVTTTR
jgi:hypothetical protein